jgi:hypothetical protein
VTAGTLLREIRVALVGAGVLLVADGVVYGSFLLSAVVCPTWFLAVAARAIIRREDWRLSIARVAVPLITLGIVLGNAALQSRIARANAERIIDAVTRYRAAHGSYPRAIDALAPRFLDSVPRAKYALAFATFKYFEFRGEHTLMWVSVPPFGRPYYSFEKARWGYLD